MKKFALLMLLCAFAFGGFVSAEVKEITIGGTIDLDLIWRDNMEDFNNDAKDQPAYAELEVNVPITATFTDNVSARIMLEEGANSDGVGRNNIGFDIDEAYITMKEFLWDKLTFQIGKMPIENRYSIRGKEGQKSLRRGSNWIVGNDDIDPLGTLFVIDFESWRFDFFWFKIEECSKGATSGGKFYTGTGNSLDMDFYGFAVDYNWNEVDLIRGMIVHVSDNFIDTYSNNADREMTVVTIGTDLFFVEKKLELYGELGYQFGDANDPAELDHDSFGGYVGIEYTWGQDWHPYLGFEILYLEGDSDDEVGWSDLAGYGTNVNRTGYVSGNATTLIFEGDNQDHMQFEEGGYWRISAVGGIKTLPHNMRLDFVAAWFQSTDDSADNAAGDNIGWEFDAIWGWNYTPDVKFELGFGWFFVDDDYAENGGARGVNGYNMNRDDDDAWMLVWNTTIKF